MMQQILTWLGKRLFPSGTNKQVGAPPGGVRVRTLAERGQLAAAPADKAPIKATPSFEPEITGRIENGGPGKNVYVRSKYVREDTGTHEVLKIVDESLFEDNPDDGIDPYNTGRFDRSKSWSSHYRK